MSESKLDLEPCAICLEDIKEPHKTKCNHVFCKDCIVKWSNVNNTCPMCRFNMVVDLNLLHNNNDLCILSDISRIKEYLYANPDSMTLFKMMLKPFNDH